MKNKQLSGMMNKCMGMSECIYLAIGEAWSFVSIALMGEDRP